jgi:hypothetical protein
LTGLPDQLGGTISDSQLAPIVAFQVLLVGPWNGASTTLTTGADTMSISTDSEFFATFGLPTGCTFFDSPGAGEDANSTYSEVPANPSQTFVQTFGVS